MTEYLLNLFDPAVQADPYGSYAEMRDLGPVLWNSLMGAWMVWPYDDVLGILKDPDTYSSAAMRQRGLEQARQRGETEDNFGAPTMLNSDPPDHDRYRGVVARAFTPRAVTGRGGEHRHRQLPGMVRRLRHGRGPADGGGSPPVPGCLELATRLLRR